MMNTKILMISSSLLMAACGVLFQFIPHEVLHVFNTESTGVLPLFVQIMGAMFLGFAMLNWMAKAVLIGGIYARPLAMGNFLHFTVGALALVKFALNSPNLLIIWVVAIVYSIFAILFGFVLFGQPAAAKGLKVESKSDAI